MPSIPEGPGLHEIARGVYAWIGPEGRTNAGFVVWDDGILVVDSLYGPTLCHELMEQVRSVSDLPIQYVVDTHEHFDHCFGNQYYEPALMVGHENCRRALVENAEGQRNFALSFRPEFGEEFRNVRIVPPVVTFNETMALYPGGRAIELRYLGRAHTAGDTVVWMPDERILFAGDIFTNARSPFAKDGYPRSWVAALQRLEGFPADTFVPGHGDLGTARDVSTLRTWMADCVGTLDDARARGLDVDRAHQELQLTVPEGWPNLQGGMDLIAPFYREVAEASR